MTPAERVELIRRISQRLASESWTDIDLTLREFGLPWSKIWENQDRYAYCVHHVEQADDKSLSALASYLFGSDSERGVATGNLPWAPNRFRLFLTHVSNEKKLLSEIKQKLASKGIDGFVAHEDIEPTKEWLDQIELALETCHALAAIMTDGFHESKWTDQEIGFCIGRRVLVIPVRLGVDPYGFISRYQALTPTKRNADIIADALFDILCEHDLTAEQMARALVRQFVDSDSFASAKVNVKLLNRINKWTPELLREIEQGLEKNRQIRDAYGVSEAVRTIIKKHGK